MIQSRSYLGGRSTIFLTPTIRTTSCIVTLHVLKSRNADSLSQSSSPSSISSIPTPEDAARWVGVQPTWKYVPALVWKWLYLIHQRLLPIFHITDNWYLYSNYKQKNYDNNENRNEFNLSADFTTPIPVPVKVVAVSNNALSLWVLWNKAISAQDIHSPVYDYDWTYDLLPPITRLFVRIIPNQLFPRLYHANIEIRTAFLNQIVQNEIIRSNSKPLYKSNHTRIRLISLGAGYDVRCTRLLSTVSSSSILSNQNQPEIHNNPNKFLVDEAWELDIDDVIQSKRFMLERLHYRRNRQQSGQVKGSTSTGVHVSAVTPPSTNNCTTIAASIVRLPFLRTVNLNNSTQLDIIFKEIFNANDNKNNINKNNNNNNNNDYNVNNDLSSISITSPPTTKTEMSTVSWHTIFLVEAVFIYLDKGVPRQVLQQCYDAVVATGSTASFCFADRLENTPGGDIDAARKELASAGWELTEWFPRPGLARHMGVAHPITIPTNTIATDTIPCTPK